MHTSCKTTAAGIIMSLVLMGLATGATAQQGGRMTRLANLVVDSAQLDSYNRFLKEEIETSVRVEPGVLTLYAVADKSDPTHITILEIYADSVAYKAHLLTPHFLKYKTGTSAMVKHLELVPVTPLVPEMKIK
ncbi:putative quinol monooxygenase [Puia dinghuensis]|uniref:Antibiotic biosynthesis monooxygenase n=1 Tax=Puia dinghuensis TaxID=1792502 RepID=A0A8J2U7R2_9BACT|nr:antibiotic biosynthesis monooxygenase [Puia dinghuensis]GGA85022.1 antibiotic biosynthesis monooxygenase [Puia dinghuensis]